MAFRQTLSRIHGLSKSVVTISSVRPMVSATSAVTSKGPSSKDVPPTHTGQQFEEDDYRMARFTDKKKHVNRKFAIDLIEEAPPAEQKSRVVWCDGGGGPTGHPRVYINLDQPGNHSCGYCGLRFFKKDHHH